MSTDYAVPTATMCGNSWTDGGKNKVEAAEFGTSWIMRGEWNSRYLKNCSSHASDGRSLYRRQAGGIYDRQLQ